MTSPSRSDRFDLIVAGSGLAGLSAAIAAAEQDATVLLLAKAPLLESSSYHAQGGIAAAIAADDDPELHLADTLAAGRGLCRESSVRVLVEEAPARIAELRKRGIAFDDGLGLEGGHSRRRIVHAGGAETGRLIAENLFATVVAHPRVTLVEGERALDLWLERGRCVGLVTASRALQAAAVVVSTGGAAALWERTTNPPGAVGDGIVMAYRAGAAVADLEFVQFHPTALRESGFLLSEALRGEGALLLDADGQRFTDELAPRDEVARAIASRSTVTLDLRPIDGDRFPTLIERIEQAGIDPAVEPVPISPAAHYTMGGIVTDEYGRTDVPGLYAAGECTCTGVHGANRLASNSMLECLVFGRRAGIAAVAGPTAPPAGRPPVPVPYDAVSSGVRAAMWEHAGLIRDAAGLEQLRNAPHALARLVAASAVARRESRGGHFRADFPRRDSRLDGVHTVLRVDHDPVLERWT